uniref:EGF-like domain-containing protein n=1 Tax=Amphiprion percula TaxID=161767 RepID=A0A3P8SXG3_AMPPE
QPSKKFISSIAQILSDIFLCIGSFEVETQFKPYSDFNWDGTACGYKVCQNGGRCRPTGSDSFTCICPPLWTGSVCNQSINCVNNNCRHGSLCVPSNITSYSCMCPIGWGGMYCDKQIPTDILRFVGNSYVKYLDPRYNTRNLKHTQVSFSFRTNSNDSLIMWMGKAEHEDDDYLAVGLERSHLKIADLSSHQLECCLAGPIGEKKRPNLMKCSHLQSSWQHQTSHEFVVLGGCNLEFSALLYSNKSVFTSF